MKPLNPLSSHFHLPLAVCAGGRIRDSKRLLVDIGMRSQKACDALNFFDELVSCLAVSQSLAHDSKDGTPAEALLKPGDDLLDRIRNSAYTE